MSTEKLQDVVVFEIATRKIVIVAGRNLSDKGFHTVDKRIATVSEKLSDAYDVIDVEAGKYKIGDTLPDKP